MGFFRFRRSVKLFPGIRLNFGKKSSSVSFGGRGFHYTVGSHGSRTTVGLPGTGLSYTNIHGRSKRQVATQSSPDLEEWCRRQSKKISLSFPDREPNEPDATAQQLNTIRSFPIRIDEATLARLGRYQAGALTDLIKVEVEKFNQEMVQKYLRKKRGIGCLGYSIIGFFAMMIIGAFNQDNTSHRSAAPASSRARSTPTATATPSVSPNLVRAQAPTQPVSPVRPDPMAEASAQGQSSPTLRDDHASQLRAIARFPELGKKSSPLNQEFVRRYRRYQHTQSSYFDNPEWPTQLAEESAKALNAQER